MAKEKTKKPFYKKWWLWAIVVVVVIIAISQGGGDAETKADSTNSSASTVEAKSDAKEASKADKAEAPKEEAKEEAASFKMGDTVAVGDVEYVINSKKTAAQVGPSALPTKASGQFVIVDVSLKNNGNEAITVDSSFFKLQQGEKTFEADSMASMSANQGNDGGIDNSFFLQEVNPDSEISGKVAFDVSKKVAESSDLQLQVQTGFWGTESEVISLK